MGNSIQLIDQIKSALSKNKAPTAEEKNDSLALVKKLKDMDSAYKKLNVLPKIDNSAIPESLGLQPKTFIPKTDAEILEAAEIALIPSYTQKTEKLAYDKETAISKLDTAADNAQIKYENDVQKLDNTVKKLTDKHNESMIMQGLVNSSINTEGIGSIVNAYEEQSLAAKSLLETKLADITAKVSLAQLNFEQALYQYDLQYAASLESKVTSLKLEQEKIKEDINTYNKKIAEQELKYKQEREKKLVELEADRLKRQQQLEEQIKADELKNGYSGAKAEEMEKRYNLALQTYDKLNKEVALNLINKQSAELKDTLGLYYQRLIDAIISK